MFSSQGDSDTRIIDFPRLLRLTEVLELVESFRCYLEQQRLELSSKELG